MNIAVNALEKDARDAAYALPLDKINVGAAAAVPDRHDVALLRAPAAAKTRSTTAPRASSAPIGRSPSTTTSWRSTPTTRSSRPMHARRHHHRRAGRPTSPLPMFIAMDPPKHDVQRKTVSPIVAPANLAHLEPIIRERAGKILDELPRRRDVRLGRQGLDRADDADAGDAVRLPVRGPPQADPLVGRRHRRARASGIVETRRSRAQASCMECLAYFIEAVERARQRRRRSGDLISMLAHGEATRNMSRANISAT